ncbi:hypothetical protein [Granulicella arctica]|uniref:Uncharacterized protein n=1 Tax=Granulicella arctica TaxID=940613 RepID=A0A7Y9TH49_9BACT|nr:hypothetical protein [Granulicella arctica]NYF80666.1 hypothetical protein [Granulicella arctica]
MKGRNTVPYAFSLIGIEAEQSAAGKNPSGKEKDKYQHNRLPQPPAIDLPGQQRQHSAACIRAIAPSTAH